MLRTKTNVCSTYALEHIQGFHLRDPNIAIKLVVQSFTFYNLLNWPNLKVNKEHYYLITCKAARDLEIPFCGPHIKQ